MEKQQLTKEGYSILRKAFHKGNSRWLNRSELEILDSIEKEGYVQLKQMIDVEGNPMKKLILTKKGLKMLKTFHKE